VPLNTIQKKKVDFGFKKVDKDAKSKLVEDVFDSVVPNYNAMNDLMSFCMHRVWKQFAIACALVKSDTVLLDIACGTCDLAKYLLQSSKKNISILACDINQKMVNQGRSAMHDHGLLKGIHYLCADAEMLPLLDNSFNRITLAFGLRNMTDKKKALSELYRVCRPLGKIIILEFSTPTTRTITNLYERYAFDMIPSLGQYVAGNSKSYQYLVESISKHPNQKDLEDLIKSVGFKNTKYVNLLGGVVAIHVGYKC
jgi:demethylmenaquinone methyltransferase / 2-methoxy-6-polyprenyl-1,4-benzoquinol methylase